MSGRDLQTLQCALPAASNDRGWVQREGAGIAIRQSDQTGIGRRTTGNTRLLIQLCVLSRIVVDAASGTGRHQMLLPIQAADNASVGGPPVNEPGGALRSRVSLLLPASRPAGRIYFDTS
jgi:hypothetical protein